MILYQPFLINRYLSRDSHGDFVEITMVPLRGNILAPSGEKALEIAKEAFPNFALSHRLCVGETPRGH